MKRKREAGARKVKLDKSSTMCYNINSERWVLACEEQRYKHTRYVNEHLAVSIDVFKHFKHDITPFRFTHSASTL